MEPIAGPSHIVESLDISHFDRDVTDLTQIQPLDLTATQEDDYNLAFRIQASLNEPLDLSVEKADILATAIKCIWTETSTTTPTSPEIITIYDDEDTEEIQTFDNIEEIINRDVGALDFKNLLAYLQEP